VSVRRRGAAAWLANAARVLLGLREGAAIALDAIRANRLRAGLTILGIAVGVFVVTAMSAAVHGIDSGVEQSLAAAGPTTFFVTRWPLQVNSCSGDAGSCPWRHNRPLSLREAAIVGALPAVHAVIAHVNTTAVAKVNDRVLRGAIVDAYTAQWLEVDPGSVVTGRTFTARENDDASPVALVNDVVVTDLFPGGGAVGETVILDGHPFLVIGVYQTHGNFFDPANKPKLIVPFETARRLLAVDIHWLDLTVKPREGVSRDEAMDDATAALRIHRRLRPAIDNTFFLYGQEKVMELYNKTVAVFFLVMIVLSGIGLLVGGVGVVAIMMISVTERTREIGLRKALGATRIAILWQFLVEAVTLTSIGAVIGLAIGQAASWGIRAGTPVSASIPPVAILAALAASAITGVFFGLLPALRAARLDPVAALRYE
jgi:putative ABC transport system permease protein